MTRTILTIHNAYQHPGGEDQVFSTEAALLEQQGHTVIRYQDYNHRIRNAALTALAGIWNQASYIRIHALARKHRPDLAHFHNTFPLVSPSAYYAVRRLGIPVVQTLSNFRLLCPGSLFLRDGLPCELCLQQNSLHPAITHKCYRDSRAATAAVVAMLATHRLIGTWWHRIDFYVALSRFARTKFIQGGLPEDRIAVKSNFIDPDPGPGDGSGNYALFVGRLSEEKGIRTLIEAWRRLAGTPLVVAGDGPLANSAWPQGVTALGHQPRERVLDLMKSARVLIFPSICYENAPLTILEAYACGLPVIASDIGSIPEFVDHHRTGLLFRPRNPEDLAHHARWAFDHPDQLKAMRAAARREFETKYTAEINYKRLIEIYEQAIEHSKLAPAALSLVPGA